MGVPQARERVFFIVHRKDLNYPKLELTFHEPSVFFRDVRSKTGVPLKEGTQTAELMKKRIPSDRRLSDICIRVHGKTVASQIISGVMNASAVPLLPADRISACMTGWA